MERGLSILWIDAICGAVQNSMTPPEKNGSARENLALPKERDPSGRQAHAQRTGLPSADIPASLAEAERLRQRLVTSLVQRPAQFTTVSASYCVSSATRTQVTRSPAMIRLMTRAPQMTFTPWRRRAADSMACA